MNDIEDEDSIDNDNELGVILILEDGKKLREENEVQKVYSWDRRDEKIGEIGEKLRENDETPDQRDGDADTCYIWDGRKFRDKDDAKSWSMWWLLLILKMVVGWDVQKLINEILSVFTCSHCCNIGPEQKTAVFNWLLLLVVVIWCTYPILMCKRSCPLFYIFINVCFSTLNS